MIKILSYIFNETPFYFFVQSLWRDEAFSFAMAQKNLFKIIYLTAKDFTPPLYYILLKLWIFIFGRSEIALRSLSLLFYAFSIYVFTLILEHLLNKKTNKIIIAFATLIFATTPIIVYYAFEARMYSMLVFFSLLFYLGIITKNTKLWQISGILGFFTHYFFIFNLLAFYVTAKKTEKEKLKKILFIPGIWLIFIFILKFTNKSISFWIEKLSFKDVLLIPFYLLSAYDKNWEKLHPQATIISLIFYFIIFLALKFSLHKNKRTKKLIILWFILPIAITSLLSITILPTFLPRYLLFTIPAFIILTALIKPKRTVYITLSIILLFNLYYNFYLVKHKKKSNYKEKSRKINQLIDKNTTVYLLNPEEYFVFAYYLGKEKVYIYNKNYKDLPAYIGKVLIPKEKLVYQTPIYPNKAIFIDKSLNTYIISLK